ncbi:MAG TPA: hypothetical protein VLT88_00750, partial [Desulfosarcina sp.]|nr:hypothetical protein [Desulfosarcina sp.]
IRLLVLLAALTTLIHCMEDRQPAADSPQPAAQKAHVDPDTGELVPRPFPNQAVPVESGQLSTLGTTDEAVEIVPSPVPGGGVMIDLKGRFHNPVSATMDDGKEPRIGHAGQGQKEPYHAAP